MIPQGYKQLAWIKNTSNVGIKTGYSNITPNLSVDLDFIYHDNTADGGLIFGYVLSDSDSWRFFRYNGNFYFDCGSSSARLTGSNFELNKRYKLKLGNNYIKDVSNFNLAYGFQNASTFSDRNNELRFETNAHVTVYRVKIYQNHILVSDLVPCKEISTNFIGLYDIINQNFIKSGSQENLEFEEISSGKVTKFYNNNQLKDFKAITYALDNGVVEQPYELYLDGLSLDVNNNYYKLADDASKWEAAWDYGGYWSADLQNNNLRISVSDGYGDKKIVISTKEPIDFTDINKITFVWKINTTSYSHQDPSRYPIFAFGISQVKDQGYVGAGKNIQGSAFWIDTLATDTFSWTMDTSSYTGKYYIQFSGHEFALYEDISVIDVRIYKNPYSSNYRITEKGV